MRDGKSTQRSYQSRFEDWDARSSVRAKPLAVFPAAGEPGKLFFSPELVPAATHQLVGRRGPGVVQRMLALHLLTHLDFTDVLENELVVPVSYAIGRAQLGFAIPHQMRADARRIGVDEMHHALSAAHLVHDLERFAEPGSRKNRAPSYLQEVARLQADAPAPIRYLVPFLAAVVSETLITGTLSRVPKDARVCDTVRRALRDHAEDEARHHAFFCDAMAIAWPQMQRDRRGMVGPLLPRLVQIFLQPDWQALREDLRIIGLTGKEIETVVADSYPERQIRDDTARAATAAVNNFLRCGVLDDAETADAFAAAGLRHARAAACTNGPTVTATGLTGAAACPGAGGSSGGSR